MNTTKDDTRDLVADFLARGGQVTVIPEAPRVPNAKLARTGAETFFARQAIFNRRVRKGEAYYGK